MTTPRKLEPVATDSPSADLPARIAQLEIDLSDANQRLVAQEEELQIQIEALQAQTEELAEMHRAAVLQKELTERIIQSSAAGISYMNCDLIYEWVNPTQAGLWGIPVEKIIGRSVADVFGISGDSEVVRLLRGVIETRQPYQAADFPFTYEVEGEIRTTLWDFGYQPVYGQHSDVLGVLVTANEVTERRRSEEVLRESQERYRSLFEASRDAIVTASLERGIIDVNPAFTQMFGLSLSDIEGQNSRCLYADTETFSAVGARVLGNMDRREPVVLETEMKRRDGTVFPVEVNSYLLRDGAGQPTRLIAVLRDLTERREAEQRMSDYNRELAAQKAFAENLIQSVPTGIAFLDRDLVFRVVKPVYANFVQIPAVDIVDRFVFDVLPADRSQIEPILRDVIETGKPFYASEFPFTYTTSEGIERTTYWDFVYYPVRENEHEPVRGVFALADEISDRIEQTREQRQLREEHQRLQAERLETLEQTDKLKDQFLGILSHELRTPINAIMGFGSVLDDEVVGPLTEQQHMYTTKILSSADALLALIEDLLIVSRVQAGKFSVSPQTTSFPSLVDDALATQAPSAVKKGIALIDQVPRDLPVLSVDPLRITQVINNLISNAIKFASFDSEVVVSARLVEGELRCEVTDAGVGIAAEDVPKLFQRFTQLDMSNTRAASGAGLGLSIVKAIVDAHGGRVGVDSQPGRGSTFWFTLPTQRSATIA